MYDTEVDIPKPDWYEEKAREIFQECEDAGWNFGRGISSSDLRALFRLVAAALREVAAQAQEACAKWHDEQAAKAGNAAKRHKDLNRLKMSIRFALVRVIHEESAAAIRARKE